MFEVYSRPHETARYCSIDDYLCFLSDYRVLPDFLSKDSAVSMFMAITARRDDGSHLAVANYVESSSVRCLIRSYEGFVECICKIAVAVFNTPSLRNMYQPIQLRIAMFIEMWNLGDECSRITHREERKQLLNCEL